MTTMRIVEEKEETEQSNMKYHPFGGEKSAPKEETKEKVTEETTEEQKPLFSRTVGEMSSDEFSTLLTDVMFVNQQAQERRSRTLAERGLPENVFTRTMHFAGNTMHGVVDIAEGVTRGVVDLVTMGYAKRD